MHKQQGFGVIEIIVVIGVVALLGGLGWYVWQANNKLPVEQGTGDAVLDLAAKNTQVKSDVTRVAAGLAEYASNNTGYYPANEEELASFVSNYLTGAVNDSQITKKPYVYVMTENYAQGVINIVAGSCKTDGTGVDAPQTTRQYAVLSKLGDNTLYCTDL